MSPHTRILYIVLYILSASIRSKLSVLQFCEGKARTHVVMLVCNALLC